MINISEISNNFKGYYAAAMTDEYRIGFWPIVDDFDINSGKLLELRVFNETAEYKWFRGNVGERFFYRKLEDNEETSAKYESPIEEEQLLDIDFNKCKSYKVPGYVYMSKGGRFFLPLSDGVINVDDKPCIKVKYYIQKYIEDNESSVHSHIKDWRLVGFGEAK